MMGSDVSGHLGNSPFLPDWVRQECLTYMGTDSEVHQIADAPPLIPLQGYSFDPTLQAPHNTIPRGNKNLTANVYGCLLDVR